MKWHVFMAHGVFHIEQPSYIIIPLCTVCVHHVVLLIFFGAIDRFCLS